MMMWNISSILHNLFSCSILNFFVCLNRIFDSIVHKTKIDINCSSSIIHLSNSERNKRCFLDSVLLTFILNSLRSIFAQTRDILPLATGFKRFSNISIFKSKISNISNNKGQKISSLSIFWTWKIEKSKNFIQWKIIKLTKIYYQLWNPWIFWQDY